MKLTYCIGSSFYGYQYTIMAAVGKAIFQYAFSVALLEKQGIAEYNSKR